MTEYKKNEKRRYVGKVKEQDGQYGKFSSILIDNPQPNSEYHKGNLLWLDAESGKKYIVKQLSLRGVGEAASQNGFINSVSIDLDNDYQVEEIK